MRSRATPMALLVAASALAAAACQNEVVPVGDVPGFLAARPECPHAWIWPADSTQHYPGLHNALIGNVNLVREVINVPEFHDCQRFIARDSAGQLVYREFFAIWASSRLPHLVRDLVDVPSGRLDTIGMMPPPVGDQAALAAEPPPIAPPDSTLFSVAVAEIYAEGRYEPLGIEPWLNCLYLFRGAGQWAAYMVPVGHNDVRCARLALSALPAASGATRLQVIATSFPEFRLDSDYPPVARWDWDRANSQQYVGIKCGAAWCEVGRQGFRPSDPLPVAATDPRGVKRVRLIKGWHDQQFLADETAGQMRPTTIVGTILPDSMLGRLDHIGDFGDFVPTADVVLTKGSAADDAALGRYLTKFGFTEATLDNPNKVSLCFGPRCRPRAGETAVSCAPGADWRARVEPAAPTAPPPSVLKCVRRRDATAYFAAPSAGPGVGPPAILVPGAARWRWLARDEGSWWRCMNGCCSSEI